MRLQRTLEHDQLLRTLAASQSESESARKELVTAMEAMSDERDRPRTVGVECFSVDGGRVSIRVRDSGPGLRTGSEGLIFEPFYTTKTGGMGMGLSIVRSIVQAHGGQIHAANDPSRGAVFEILLPQRSDKAA